MVTPRGIERADVAIENGLIADVGRDLDSAPAEIDATGLHVFPGGIDSHVHFNEPGRTDWEDIAHGSAALAAGGCTTFIDMPLNNLPVTTSAEAFDLKLAAMQRSARVDYGLWAGLVPGNLDQLGALVQRGAMGFKAFMCPSGIDEFPMIDEASLREGMKRLAELGSIVLVHAESPARLNDPKGPTARDFNESRPVEAELDAVAAAIQLAEETGCRLHVVHVSSAAGVDVIESAQARGIDVSGETCPHYLIYRAGDLARLGGLGKCAPPFRTAGDQQRISQLPMVVSDHSPSTLDLKRGDDFRTIWGGIAGCQHTRQLLLARGVEPDWLCAVTATNIASRFRLKGKGDVAPGFDADLWIADLAWQGDVRRGGLLYRNPFSVHEGQPIRGRTVHTVLRGDVVKRDAPLRGRFLRPE